MSSAATLLGARLLFHDQKKRIIEFDAAELCTADKLVPLLQVRH